MLSYGSVCSGIEAASVAWHPLGMKPLWFSEIEEFPSAVLEKRWPDVPNLGDMTKLSRMVTIKWIDAPDVLVGGTPCQAFSISGLRESLDDDRGKLTMEFVRLANAIDTRRLLDGRNESIIVWENVPGVLSTKDNAFGNFIAALCGESEALQPPGKKWTNAGIVHGPQRTVAWRVLDAQYFGVAQRRKRVFVVASARDGFDPAEILFESEGLRRDLAPSREARKEVTELAGTLTANTGGLTRPAGNCNELDFCVMDGQQVPFNKQRQGEYSGDDIGSTCAARDYKDATDLIVHPIHDKATRYKGGGETRNGDGAGNGLGIGSETDPSYTLTSGDKHALIAFSCTDNGRDCKTELAPTMRAMNGIRPNGGGQLAVCYDTTQITSPDNHSNPKADSPCHTLNANEHVPLIVPQVRRLTPVECERLQGFPDNYTNIPFGRPKHDDQICPDSHRYKAIGNSMAVPVMRWIGERILNA